MPANSVLLIFVDGLGIGARSDFNPLKILSDEAFPLAIFENEEPALPFDGRLARTDARLGVEGRPQSASGQTTILTGVNAPAALGYHKQGFPNKAMREIIRERSIFLQLARAKVCPNVFANAYTQRFFEERPRWISATTAAVEAASLPFRTVEDLRRGLAVFHDFTNRQLIARGEDVEELTPEEAAKILARVASVQSFTLYEYFLTDRAGHAQDMKLALQTLGELARFVRAVLESVDLLRTNVILTSDHGNVEDLSTKNHTLNAVPTLAWGPNRERVQKRVRTLADITPSIVELLSEAVAEA